jgi:hypothetical protein
MIANIPEEMCLTVCSHGQGDNDGRCIRNNPFRDN